MKNQLHLYSFVQQVVMSVKMLIQIITNFGLNFVKVMQIKFNRKVSNRFSVRLINTFIYLFIYFHQYYKEKRVEFNYIYIYIYVYAYTNNKEK